MQLNEFEYHFALEEMVKTEWKSMHKLFKIYPLERTAPRTRSMTKKLENTSITSKAMQYRRVIVTRVPIMRVELMTVTRMHGSALRCVHTLAR